LSIESEIRPLHRTILHRSSFDIFKSCSDVASPHVCHFVRPTPIGIPRSQFKEPRQDEVVGQDGLDVLEGMIGQDVLEGMIGQDNEGMCHMSSLGESILDLAMFFDY
jgi:hypothetical protein